MTTPSDGSASLAATWLHVGPGGVARRVEVRGADRAVRVDSSGNPAGSSRATAVGTWRGEVSAEALAELEAALGKLEPASTPLPKVEAEGTSIWFVTAKAAGARALSGDVATRLGTIFEAIAAKVKPFATVAMELQIAAGAEWTWTLRVKAAGTEPVVVAHPSHAAARGELVAARGGRETPLALEKGPPFVVVAPDEPLVVAWKSPPLGGDGPVEIWWTAKVPGLEAQFANRRAPEGVFTSNAVRP